MKETTAATESTTTTADAPREVDVAKMRDEFHGVGGSYVIENGVRKLKSRTEDRGHVRHDPDEADLSDEAKAARAARKAKAAK